jgi:hypothetical protein
MVLHSHRSFWLSALCEPPNFILVVGPLKRRKQKLLGRANITASSSSQFQWRGESQLVHPIVPSEWHLDDNAGFARKNRTLPRASGGVGALFLPCIVPAN